jgi:hypothetical protein
MRNSPIAYVALFVALGSTAWAAGQVTSGDIAADAVRSKHIAPNQVKLADTRKPSVSKLFGSGWLGGQRNDFGIPAGISGSDSVAAVGASDSPGDAFNIVAPGKLVLRDLMVRAEAPVPVRGVRFSLRKGNLAELLSCTIPVGRSRCVSGKKAKLVVQRGQSFDGWIEDVGPSDEELPEMDYHFGYRVAPSG